MRLNSCGAGNHSRRFGCNEFFQLLQKGRLVKNSNAVEIVFGNSQHPVNQSILVVHNGGKTTMKDPGEIWMFMKEVPTDDFHCSLHRWIAHWIFQLKMQWNAIKI